VGASRLIVAFSSQRKLTELSLLFQKFFCYTNANRRNSSCFMLMAAFQSLSATNLQSQEKGTPLLDHTPYFLIKVFMDFDISGIKQPFIYLKLIISCHVKKKRLLSPTPNRNHLPLSLVLSHPTFRSGRLLSEGS